MRTLRFNYSFNTGFVQPWPLMQDGSLNYYMLYGQSGGVTASQSEIFNFLIATVTDQAKSFTLSTTSTNAGYINIAIPCQIGYPYNFYVNNNLTTFNQAASNDQDALNDTGSNSGEPYFIFLNGVQYAYNLYVSGVSFAAGTYTVLINMSSSGGGITPPPPQQYTVYYGFTPSQPPTNTQVAALAQVLKTNRAGTYTLTQPGTSSQYPAIGWPVALGVASSFTISGFPYTFNQETVSISGTSYYVYYLTSATSGTSLPVTVT